ncbi:hypothetical protein FHT87_002649 [Rhizobium sp. BK316]|uniref:hypothetical protein n=1 Tax=Rhizobium sp. BK316 TaxID=2587053 RepID=UPI00161B502F|nr:hypothetical protein [Rhizobium sp. BK316]MBB3408746.1 hypothetical protein [Rhizobium sp. BK316]
MAVIVYQCTADPPNWNFFSKTPRGIAYETSTHFVHQYGGGDGVYTISPGLTVTEAKSGSSLQSWVVQRFGAQGIETARLAEGEVIDKVWRPGLYYEVDILQALNLSMHEIQQTERSLLLLFHRLNEVLNFIEPSTQGLASYGHRTRELLILACTEVEDQWSQMLRSAGVTQAILKTKDYFRLKAPLHLAEFEVGMPTYANVAAVAPFRGWSTPATTQSLPWYDAYNKTKHDKKNHFADATLQHCIEAVAANVALFCARFGPYRLIENRGTIGTQFNELFRISMLNPNFKTFYVPKIDITKITNPQLIVFNGSDHALGRTAHPLTV